MAGWHGLGDVRRAGFGVGRADLPESHLAQRGCQRKSTLFESKIRVTDIKSRTIRGN